MPLKMTDDLTEKVLHALEKLDPLATVKKINEASGLNIGAPDLRPLVTAGLVAMSEVNKPPIFRFDLTAGGRRWLDLRHAGAAAHVPMAQRPADPPLVSATAIEELYQRFDTGEGATLDSCRQLARDLGMDVDQVKGYRGVWRKQRRAQAALPMDPPAPEPNADWSNQPDPAPSPDPENQTEPAAPFGTPLTPEAKAQIHERFAAGEGKTAISRRALAAEFGLLSSQVYNYLVQWRKAAKFPPGEPPAPPVVDPAPQISGAREDQGQPLQAPPKNEAEPTGHRITPGDIERLYARFAAGEGTTAASKEALSREFHMKPTTISYHLTMWRKKPKADDGPPSDRVIDGQVGGVEIEHQAGHAQQASQGAAIDAEEWPPEIEQAQRDPGAVRELAESGQVAPEMVCPPLITAEQVQEHVGNLIDPTPEAAAALEELGVTQPEPTEEHQAEPGEMQQPEESTETTAPATLTAESSTNTAPASTPEPQTAMAAALLKAGLVPPGADQQTPLPPRPGRRLACQVCHQPVDSLLWYTDQKSGLSGHRGCVTAPVLQQADVEPIRLPEVGEICEGVVFAVDQTGMYALIDLTAYSRPERKEWVRGKVTRSQVLRHGWCEDARDWLQAGDLVNVKVLEVTPGQGGRKSRLNLSVKQAPAHTHERIQLEVHEQPREPEEPIVARGAEVVAALATEPAPDETQLHQARIAAADLVAQYRLDPSHTDDLAERILASGVPQVTAELEADLKTMAELKASAAAARSSAVLGHAAAALNSEDPDSERIAETVAPQLHDELLAARQEIEMLRVALDSARAEAKRMTKGLCATCVHRLDGFCPYPDMVAEIYDLPEDDRSERHRGRRIKFGPRPMIDCELYRRDGGDTAAD